MVDSVGSFFEPFVMVTFSRTLVLALAAGLIASGCKKKSESQPLSAPSLESPPISQRPEVAPPAAVSANARTTLDHVNSALKKHDFESATVGLINLGLSGRP